MQTNRVSAIALLLAWLAPAVAQTLPATIDTYTLLKTHTISEPLPGVGDFSDIAFSSNGMRMFILGFSSRIFVAELGAAFDPSNITSSRIEDFNLRLGALSDIEFSPNGEMMFLASFNGNSIHAYTLSTAFDIASTSRSPASPPSLMVELPDSLAFSDTGRRLFVGDGLANLIQFTLPNSYQLPANADGSITRSLGGCLRLRHAVP